MRGGIAEESPCVASRSSVRELSVPQRFNRRLNI